MAGWTRFVTSIAINGLRLTIFRHILERRPRVEPLVRDQFSRRVRRNWRRFIERAKIRWYSRRLCRACLSDEVYRSQSHNRSKLRSVLVVAVRCQHCGELFYRRGPLLLGPRFASRTNGTARGNARKPFLVRIPSAYRSFAAALVLALVLVILLGILL